MKQIRRLHVHADQSALIDTVQRAIATAAVQAIAAHGAFHCVLAGGETPRRLYEQLRTLTADWAHWHLYFGDERCLPAGDGARNDVMAEQAWLAHVPIPGTQIHPLRAELGAERAAEEYVPLLDRVPHFDLVLLGLGEDGHTASLFPQHQSHLLDDAVMTIAHDAPKPPPQRVSLSARRLGAAEAVWFLVCGENKRGALTHWLSGAAIPAALVTPPGGVDIHTDLAGLLPL